MKAKHYSQRVLLIVGAVGYMGLCLFGCVWYYANSVLGTLNSSPLSKT